MDLDGDTALAIVVWQHVSSFILAQMQYSQSGVGPALSHASLLRQSVRQSLSCPPFLN